MKTQAQILNDWYAIKNALESTDLGIKAFALVAIDATGTAHWGANFTGTIEAQRTMSHWLKVMAHDVDDLIKKRIARGERDEAAQ